MKMDSISRFLLAALAALYLPFVEITSRNHETTSRNREITSRNRCHFGISDKMTLDLATLTTLTNPATRPHDHPTTLTTLTTPTTLTTMTTQSTLTLILTKKIIKIVISGQFCTLAMF